VPSTVCVTSFLFAFGLTMILNFIELVFNLIKKPHQLTVMRLIESEETVST
jgi:hypothetical protein